MDERLATETIVDGRYRVLERIGSGGMADVYRAEDLQLGRDVALKILYRRFSEDPEFVERFRREASSAAGLQHPHVVSVYDRGEWDGTYYIAMEHLDGRSLKRIVLEEGPLDPARAVDLVSQILRAAKFAHKRGIIHRDLKPHNVIVDSEGRAKVTDFGIALAGASDMTQTGSIMGTAQYLSPEQAQGQAVTGQSDLYAIGVILFELLTGRIPFDGESAVTIALKQVQEQAIPPSRLRPGIAPDLDAVVLRALEKDPARRFSDAEEFIVALEDVASRLGDGGSAATSSTGVTSVAAAGVAGAAAAAAYGHAGDQHTQVPGTMPAVSAYDGYAYPTTAPPEPEPRDDDGRKWWLALLLGLLIAGAIIGGLLLAGGQKVTVPRVVGADEASAQQRLRTDGFSTDVVRKTDDNAPKGQVIGQIPGPGTKLEKGGTVTLTVSDGPGTVRVPAVSGQGRLAASKALRDAGFLIREREAFSAEVGENRVISTTPQEGTALEKGATVTIVVSSGAERAAVPSVLDQAQEEATATLEDAGFVVSVREQENADKEPGTVLLQDPKAGARAKKGSRVTITVAKAPEAVDVPNVVGQSSADAVAALSGAGFAVVQKRQEVDTLDEDDTVLAQSPAGGKLKKGQKVTITVGKFTPDLDPDPTPTPEPTATTETTG